jgi:membrane-associated phospholipid phosphatase
MGEVAISSRKIGWSSATMFEPNAYAVYLAISFTFLLLFVGFVATDFYYTDDGISGRSANLAFLAVCGILMRGFGLVRTAAAIEAMAIMTGFALIMLVFCMMLAGTAQPLVDKSLIAIDRALGFDWLALHMLLRGNEIFFQCANLVYRALHWEPLLLVILLASFGHILQVWTFVTAWTIAVVITVAIFPFTPALGGFLYYGITPEDVSGLWIPGVWEWYDVMKPVREGTLRGLGANSVAGIVTFPSLHAAGAILLAYGFWQFRWLKWPMLILNIGVFLSSIVVGGHYLTDVIAGGLIAIVAILFTLKILKRPATKSPIRPSFQPQPASGRSD